MRKYFVLCGMLAMTLSGVSHADPFEPCDIGGEAAVWQYEDLAPDDQVTADLGLNEDQTAVQAGYAAASAVAAEEADVAAAASQLGLDGALDEIGVVP